MVANSGDFAYADRGHYRNRLIGIGSQLTIHHLVLNNADINAAGTYHILGNITGGVVGISARDNR